MEQPAAGRESPPEAPFPALVVEDDAGWRSLISELLVEAGFQPRSSVSYVEALGRLRSEEFRLVVADLSLASSLEPESNQDGYRILAHTQKAGIPTIIVSGYADPADIERAYAQYQLFACLEKQGFNRKNFIETAQKARQARLSGPGLEQLTGRELEVLSLLAQGYKNKDIAAALYITPNTVKRHLKSLFAKLGVNTRSAAATAAARAGLVKPSPLSRDRTPKDEGSGAARTLIFRFSIIDPMCKYHLPSPPSPLPSTGDAKGAPFGWERYMPN